jgi:hypothetical protein
MMANGVSCEAEERRIMDVRPKKDWRLYLENM